ncbi:MAG: hypothetical protein KME30_25075 [Iphinoe sp. HA4291-MV1]|nr:hypothetical protein [Iphinoe sp. HA4291-MV1]
MAKRSAKGKQTSKTRFIESFGDLLYDYIKRTGDESDLEWVPFADIVRGQLSVVYEAPVEVMKEKDEDKVINFLNGIQSTVALDLCKWQQIECATQRNPDELQRLIDGCVTKNQIELKNQLPIKLARYMKSLGVHAVIDWIPERTLAAAEAVIEEESEAAKKSPFKVGEMVYCTDLYASEADIAWTVVSIDGDWINVRSGLRTSQLHVSEANLCTNEKYEELHRQFLLSPSPDGDAARSPLASPLGRREKTELPQKVA